MMRKKNFEQIVLSLAGIFTLAFCYLVIPPLITDFAVISAFSAGFVNPFSSAYAIDAISCWLILAVWVRYEAINFSIKYGWLCLILGVIPGVAAGLGLYLVVRQRQLGAR